MRKTFYAVACAMLFSLVSLAQNYRNDWETRFCSALRVDGVPFEVSRYCEGSGNVKRLLGDSIVNGHSNLDLLRLAIRSGMNPSAGSNRLIYTTIASRDLPALRILVSSGANLEQHFIGLTPLMYAIMFEFPEGSRLLISAGASTETVDDFYEYSPALHYAAGHVQLDVASSLLQAGANVNAVDRFKRTALHVVVGNTEWEPLDAVLKRVEMCQLLVNAGTNLNLKNKDGETAKEVAKRHPYWGIRDCTD